MPAPAYAKILASIGKFFTATVDPGATAGQAGIPLSPFNFPALPGLDMTVGTGVGQFNILGVKGGSAAGAVVDVDLTAIPDPFGTVVNAANVRFIWLLNDDTVAGHVLNVGPVRGLGHLQVHGPARRGGQRRQLSGPGVHRQPRRGPTAGHGHIQGAPD
jgi:hypothetical protein